MGEVEMKPLIRVTILTAVLLTSTSIVLADSIPACTATITPASRLHGMTAWLDILRVAPDELAARMLPVDDSP
jgi:hypothetical protein